MASSFGDEQILYMLLSHGLDPDVSASYLSCYSKSFRIKDAYSQGEPGTPSEQTPLWLAVSNSKNTRVVQLLIEFGAKVELIGLKSGRQQTWPLLWEALVEHREYDMAELLLSCASPEFVNFQNPDTGNSILHEMVDREDEKGVRLLMESVSAKHFVEISISRFQTLLDFASGQSQSLSLEQVGNG